MDDFQLDARKWRFLNNPGRYLREATGGLHVEPLKRQFRTAKDILARFVDGRGVLLADDVGLGKTTIGALVAWAVACQNKRVRIYAPNEVLRRRWAEELERHVPMLSHLGASTDCIKQGEVERLNWGRIQVATHHALVKSHSKSKLRVACDLMIIDEAHRAKGEGSAFNEALHSLGDHAKRKLILTATPFSIRLTELEQLLRFAGATELEAVRHYAMELKRLYTLGQGHDLATEAQRLLGAAEAAIAQLQPYVVRHGIDDLSASEKKHFGVVAATPWRIATASATHDDLSLLLRMDRLLQLTAERKGERRNDPRFHTGWQHVGTALARVMDQDETTHSLPIRQHIHAAKSAHDTRSAGPHPKIAAVTEAVRAVLDDGEKVLVFCHHRATARELLEALEWSLKMPGVNRDGPPEKVWRAAWEAVLHEEKSALVAPIIDWLCTSGLRVQISGWLTEPADTPEGLVRQFQTIRPRNAAPQVAVISQAAQALVRKLLDEQSTSTLALLKSMTKKQRVFGGELSHFPGGLDDGHRVMGTWHHEADTPRPKTLYTGKPDIVIDVFNSPFGPDVLIATDRLSEGVDLHRCCRHLIHYELDPSPVRTLQRNGRVRRVGSWASLTSQPICYAYPSFDGTRDEKAVQVMKQRINAFGLLLGGVPSLDDENVEREQSFAETALGETRKRLSLLNRRLAVP